MFSRNSSKSRCPITSKALTSSSTLRATLESPDLSSYLSRAQPLRARIEKWRQSLPLLSKPTSEMSSDEFDDGASLRLSHLTLEILIFRALLRPLSQRNLAQGESEREPVTTIFENCYACAKIAVEIVSSLRAKHFATFWAHCKCPDNSRGIPRGLIRGTRCQIPALLRLDFHLVELGAVDDGGDGFTQLCTTEQVARHSPDAGARLATCSSGMYSTGRRPVEGSAAGCSWRGPGQPCDEVPPLTGIQVARGRLRGYDTQAALTIPKKRSRYARKLIHSVTMILDCSSRHISAQHREVPVRQERSLLGCNTHPACGSCRSSSV